jgi:hypothetical protein
MIKTRLSEVEKRIRRGIISVCAVFSGFGLSQSALLDGIGIDQPIGESSK